MDSSSLASVALILGGAVILGTAALRTGGILRLVENTPQAASWRQLRALMFSFIGGYILAIGVVLTASGAALGLLTGAVFLGGAMFVLLVVRLGYTTVSELKHAVDSEQAQRRELQRTMGKLEHTNEALTKSNAELEQFAYVASHDLQEPLRKVKAFGELLETECAPQLGEDGQLYVSRMRKAADRMSKLIDDLLAFSRVTRKSDEFTQVDLKKVVSGVIDDLQERIQGKSGSVTVGELPTISARETHMRQLFQNLIANSLKFHREGVAPEVRLAARELEEEGLGPVWELVVEDNGIGFEPKYTDRIFGIFQRLHGRNEYEGTGVGLSICQKIAIGHGGRIRAEGTPGQGARFVVTLPRADTQEAGGEDERR